MDALYTLGSSQVPQIAIYLHCPDKIGTRVGVKLCRHIDVANTDHQALPGTTRHAGTDHQACRCGQY